MRSSPLAALALVVAVPLAVIVACGGDDSDGSSSGVDADDGAAPAKAAVPSTDGSTSSGGDDGGFLEDAATSADAADGCAPASRWCVLHAVHASTTCNDAGTLQQTCPMSCTGGACNTSCNAATVVIDQATADDHLVMDVWQTFKVGASGVLTAIAARPNVFSAEGNPSIGKLSIYVGDGIAGTRLHQQDFNLPSAGGSPLQTFTLTTPVPLVANQTYTWELTGVKDAYFAETNVYPDGHASVGTRDLVFKATFATCE